MKNKTINIGVLINVAAPLENLNEEAVYVGSAIVVIYTDGPAAEDKRF